MTNVGDHFSCKKCTIVVSVVKPCDEKPCDLTCCGQVMIGSKKA